MVQTFHRLAGRLFRKMSATNETNAATRKVEKYGGVKKLILLLPPLTPCSTVRLGNSGLKVSRIILGSSSHF